MQGTSRRGGDARGASGGIGGPKLAGTRPLIRDPLWLAATIAAGTAAALWLEARFRRAATVGAALLAILFGALLSNLELVPLRSPVYDAVFGPVTSLAIAWLLFAVPLADLKRAGPRMLGLFGLAVGGTAVGAVLASLLLAPALGDDTWRLAGALTGTYAGGSLNFVAVGRALELPASLFSATAAADNVVTAVWVGATLVLPLWLAPVFARRRGERGGRRAASEPGRGDLEEPDGEKGDTRGAPILGRVSMRPLDVAALLALGLVVMAVSEALAAVVPGVPSVLWLTTAALALGQLPPVRRLAGAMQLGYVALHLFFVLIGVGSRLEEILRVGPEVLYLTAAVVAVHGLIVYGGAWLARADVETTSVASQAAVGGPSTALALAVAREWPGLALPGMAVGLLGYAVGNYAGFGIGWLVRVWLGG